MAEFSNITSPPWSMRTRRTVTLILLLLAGIFAWRLGDMWPPVIISLILAYLLSPLVNWIERHAPLGKPSTRRMLGTVLTFVLAVLAVVLILLTIIPAIVAQVRQFGEVLPSLFDRIEVSLSEVLSTPIAIGTQTIVPWEVIRTNIGSMEETFELAQVDFLSAIQSLLGPVTTPVLGALGSALSGVLSTIFVLTMIFYLMKDGPTFIQQIEDMVPEPYRDDVRLLLFHLGEIWNAYLRGQIILSLTMGIIVFLASTILGLRSPLVLGLLSGVLEFIPNIGPALALIPAASFALFFPSTTIPGLEGAFFMLVVVLVWTGLQNIEAIFFVPRIMGDSLDLHPFIVIVAVIGGASLAGALGVILAAPVVATLRLLGSYFFEKLRMPEPPELSPVVLTPLEAYNKPDREAAE